MTETEPKIPFGNEDNQVYTYKLPNGTHVLIHQQQPSTELCITANKEDFGMIPILLLEDNQIACSEGDSISCIPKFEFTRNQIYLNQLQGENGDAILTSEGQVVGQLPEVTIMGGANTDGNLVPADTIPNIDLSAQQFLSNNRTNANLDLGAIGTTEQTLSDGILNVTGSQESSGASLDNEIVFHNIDDFVDVVTTYRCRMCPFNAPSKSDLLKHFKSCHCEVVAESLNLDEDKEQSFETAEISNTQQEDKTSEPPLSEIKLNSLNTSQSAASEKHIYLCGQCTQSFTSLEECKNHMMKDHLFVVYENAANNEKEKEKTAVYDQTEEESATLTESDEKSDHMSKQENEEYWLVGKKKRTRGNILEKKYKCSHKACLYKFSKDESLKHHMKCHDMDPSSRGFSCCECKQHFERWCQCAMHLWRDHEIDVDLLVCHMCNTYKTVTMAKLENHQKIHSEARGYTCDVCGKGFKQLSQLRNHRVVHLDRRSGDVKKWYTTKECSLCFKQYADSKCLRKHIQAVHSKLRPYVCNICGHASARKAMLQLHQRQHTGEKPYQCDQCPFKTGDHNSMRRHKMRHTGTRPYRCPHCSYASIQSNSYKNHLKNKHPGLEGVFACDQCPFKTVSEESHYIHMSDHKNGLITRKSEDEGMDNSNDVELFPGNVAAAQLIYRCLNAFSHDGNALSSVPLTGSATSPDGSTQTITIQIPTKDDTEDEEEEHCFLAIQQPKLDFMEGDVDSGGITIPADSNDNKPPDIAHSAFQQQIVVDSQQSQLVS